MAKCSHKLFGYNLECTRKVGYGGLYAEMIYNSKLLNDAAGFYPIEIDGLKGLGQCTERLHVLSGETYQWKIVAGKHTKVRIRTEFDRLLYSGEGASGTYVAKYNCSSVRFEVVSDEPITYISFMPADNYHGCRKDVLDAMKQLRPATIRVPGGCYAEARFDWKDGLLPVEEREAIPDDGLELLFSSHEKYDGHVLNVDDYAAICRYVGAEMEYTVGLRRGNPQDAADLVEYCNGGADTAYGALRIARGFEEPYQVKTWYVGNELAYDLTYEDAAERNDRFMLAMKKADPSISTVASTGNFENWDEEFLKRAKYIEQCATHYYMILSEPEWDMNYVLHAADTVLLDILRRAHVRSAGKPILFDEWNLRWGCLGDSASALFAATVMTMLIRHAEELNIVGASYFAMVNEGVIRVYPDHVCLAPDGEVLKRMALHAGGELELNEDRTYVKTVHDGFSYISIYNDSPDKERCLTGIEGTYEILRPNGIWMNITGGKGTLNSIPPASVAFIFS